MPGTAEYEVRESQPLPGLRHPARCGCPHRHTDTVVADESPGFDQRSTVLPQLGNVDVTDLGVDPALAQLRTGLTNLPMTLFCYLES